MIKDGYYYLEVGDVIKRGDEYGNVDGEIDDKSWVRLHDYDASIGKQWDGKKFFLPRRRKIKRIKFDSELEPNWQ